MGEIIPSESLSCVTYIGIDGIHSQKTKRLERTKPQKRTKYIKTALEIAKNQTPTDRKAKEQALAKRATIKRIRALQTPQKTTV